MVELSHQERRAKMTVAKEVAKMAARMGKIKGKVAVSLQRLK